MTTDELLEQLNNLKENYQSYSSPKEKEQIDSLIQKLDTNEDLAAIEQELSELKTKLDYRKSATNDIKRSMSDSQRKFIKDWSGKDVTED